LIPHFCSLELLQLLLQDIKSNYGPFTMALANKYIRENLAALLNAEETPWPSLSDAHLSLLRKFPSPLFFSSVTLPTTNPPKQSRCMSSWFASWQTLKFTRT
jgi:hypothetical protein